MIQLIKLSVDAGLATIIASVISISGVALTAFITVRVAKSKNYSSTVTKERAIWLQHFREEISDITAGLYALHSFAFDENAKAERLKIIAKAEGSRCSLISRLRSLPIEGNEGNDELKTILVNINFNEDNWDIYNEYLNQILFYSNMILEREWDKTKGENE